MSILMFLKALSMRSSAANGAGKTTLVKLLLNIIRPSSGTAAVLGKSSKHIVGDAFTASVTYRRTRSYLIG